MYKLGHHGHCHLFAVFIPSKRSCKAVGLKKLLLPTNLAKFKVNNQEKV